MSRRLTLPFASLILVSASASASDLDALVEQCDGCHGDNGVSQWNDMPTIAGIDAFVHSEALYIYQDEARPCADSKYRTGDTAREATNMCDVAAELDDDQIEALAAHYAGLPFVAAKQKFDAAKAAAGKAIHDRDCELCHTSGGTDAEDESSILGGQWMGYMRTSLEQYREGEREQPEKMREKIDGLGDDEIEALLHFYASKQ